MEIKKYWSWEVPEKNNGVAIVIDAWASTTNLNLILAKKPKKLIIVNNDNLGKAKEIYPDNLLIGESLVLDPREFVSSNFPSEIAKKDLKNKNVLYMSINGTRVLEKVKQKFKIVITCAFNNLLAVKRLLEQENVKVVNLVMSGDLTKEVVEDRICTEILENELKGKTYSWEKLAQQATDFIKSYYGNPIKQKESLPYMLDLNAYNIIPQAVKNKEGFIEVKSISVKLRL